MLKHAVLITLSVVIAFSASGCKTHTAGEQARPGVPACFVMYDAGSSRTRLFVYEQTDTGWLMHSGPTTAALADPIRGNRGKSMGDADDTIDALVAALQDMRHDGPPDSDGKPRWTAFDWPRRCNVEAADVYGTAGMRMAERQDAAASALLWNQLRGKLADTLRVPVTARTLSAYEEGLFAWLALSETQADVNFGVAEMGGASLQVTFPCRGCPGAKKVRVKDRTLEIYSRSLLGWGQDEAWSAFGDVAACERGAGSANPAWRIEDCEAVMRGFADAASDITAYIEAASGLRWYLSDAFRYMRADDIENFCRKGLDSGFEPESSCFRAVYLQNVLQSLALPADAERSDANWTLGAVVCKVTHCLEDRQASSQLISPCRESVLRP